MKVLILALFVATAFAAPAPLDEDTGEPVEFIVNGVAEGEPLELGDVLSIKVKEHVEGQVVASTDLLHPLTALGIAEAEAAAAESNPVEIKPELPTPEIPDLYPGPVVVPELILPEVVMPEILPAPPAPELESGPVILPEVIVPEAVVPEVVMPEVLPAPPAPELETGPVILPEIIVPEAESEPVIVPELPAPEIDMTPIEVLPAPAPQRPVGEVFNDGVVQVTVNAPDVGVLSTVQSWFNMVLNYFNGDVQTTHQIV